MTASTVLTVFPRPSSARPTTASAPRARSPPSSTARAARLSPSAVDRHDFELFMSHHAAGSTLVELQIEGEKKPVTAMIREVQHAPGQGHHPARRLHGRLAWTQPIHAVVPLHLVNDPAGVKAGGVLTINLHEVNIEAQAGRPARVPRGRRLGTRGRRLAARRATSSRRRASRSSTTPSHRRLRQPPPVEVEEEEVAAEAAEPELIGAKPEEE